MIAFVSSEQMFLRLRWLRLKDVSEPPYLRKLLCLLNFHLNTGLQPVISQINQFVIHSALHSVKFCCLLMSPVVPELQIGMKLSSHRFLVPRRGLQIPITPFGCSSLVHDFRFDSCGVRLRIV